MSMIHRLLAAIIKNTPLYTSKQKLTDRISTLIFDNSSRRLLFPVGEIMKSSSL